MKTLSVGDLPRFKAAFIAHRKGVWCYYVPFLLSYNLPPRRALEWEVFEESLCLFVHGAGEGRKRLDLMIPPLPCTKGAVESCAERAGGDNPGRGLRVLWADSDDADRLRSSGFRMTLKEREYLYDPSAIAQAAGRTFRDIRKKVRRFERGCSHVFRRMTRCDREGCLDLLREWRNRQGRRRGFLLDWGYTRAAIGLIGEIDDRDLSGWVVEIGGAVRAFGLAGDMGNGTGNFFVAKTDISVRGLAEFLRWRVCGEMRHFSRLNDAGDLGLPGLRQHKLKFRPVDRVSVYSGERMG